MLQFSANTTSDGIAKLVQEFDIANTTWVVSDLPTKQRIQNALLERHAVVPENAVMRANELWRRSLLRIRPDVDLISMPFAETLLADWLRKRDIKWASHPGTAKILGQYIELFLPILRERSAVQLQREWLRNNPNALLRWGNWFELACEAWEFFSAKRFIPSSWIGGFLSGEQNLEISWERNLIFNVGSELNAVEAEILKRLSRQIEITILEPDAKWQMAYPDTFSAYALLKGERTIINRPISAKRNFAEVDVSVDRFTTQIAEVKEAVHNVRKYLDAGGDLTGAAIVAGDIEQYWPALESHLVTEGIPVAKSVVVTAHSLPGVGAWLSRLRIERSDISFGDLEQSLYRAEDAAIDYARFQQLFARVYDVTDLSRDQAIQKSFEMKRRPQDRLLRDQFWLWALKFWTSEDTESIEKIAGQFLRECPISAEFDLAAWIKYLEGVAARTELTVREANPYGVQVGTLEMIAARNFDCVVILDVSEEGLQEQAPVGVSHGDTEKILQDLGFALSSPDHKRLEYLVDRAVSESRGEVVVSCAGTSFQGQARGASRLWLEFALAKGREVEKISVPGATRWDELQHASFAEMGHPQLEEFVHRDLGLLPAASFKPTTDRAFSASQVETYYECPFRYAAGKVFRLSDDPFVDLDMDGGSRGRLLHAVTERLLEPPLRLERTDDELAALIDDCCAKLAIVIGDDRLWPAKRTELIRLLRDFLKFEKEWRAKFVETSTVARELNVRGDVEWFGEKISVSGFIDRVDEDRAGRTVVVDYKSSGAGLHQHKSWMENHELQLMFYNLALREGLTDLGPRDVVAAVYYVLPKLNRSKGFRLERGVPSLYEMSGRDGAKIDDDQLRALEEKTRELIVEAVRKVRAGEFQPKPQDLKTCETCTWRTLCRAPHLS